MANPSNKFSSANLNKFYGQQQQFNGGGSYGQGSPGGWNRGGGMLVLSKNRNVQKAVSKLSVPPPLNLPSLRKEHEKYDTSGTSRGAVPGGGVRPTSARVGWTRPVSTATLHERNESHVDTHLAGEMGAKEASNRSIGSYIPPSARSNGLGTASSYIGPRSHNFVSLVEKATVLRGEDFPSLQSSRPISSESSQKQKDTLNPKQMQNLSEESNHQKVDSYHSDSFVDVKESGQPSWKSIRNASVDNSNEAKGTGLGRLSDKTLKVDEYFPSPLPLVRMNPRSDWADDERDTSHVFTERGRDIRYLKSDYWDGNFDLPRPSLLPYKVTQWQYDKWGQRDNETAGFDDRDLFSGSLGVIKRKKDNAKCTDFHDPVRESFQAELERVQKMQELERQRIIGEQERALEQAKREEEERQRRIREEEDQQRRLEEEAREAVWRAENERLEAMRVAEERKVAREEEMRRIYVEEERRKQAAMQKLLELEAKIAKRQSEAASFAKSDVSTPRTINDEQSEIFMKEKDVSRTQDLVYWEDGERMMNKLTASVTFDPLASVRPYEMGLRPYTPSEGSSSFFESKGVNYWRKDVLEDGGSFRSSQLDLVNDHYSPRQDSYGGGREISKVYPYGRDRNSSRQPRVLPPPVTSAQRSFGRNCDFSGPLDFFNNETHFSNAARGESIVQTLYAGSSWKDHGQSEVVEPHQANISVENQNNNIKSRCDSQSSLSVSSPPNSPPQLSHDELDVSEYYAIKSSMAEETSNFLTEVTVSGSVLDDISGGRTLDSVSASENDEWVIENDDALQQQQEEYDENEDAYIAEDEVREADDETFNQTLVNLELEERETVLMVDNIVLGFDEGVEVVIPRDDFEKHSCQEERICGIHDNSTNVEARGLVDRVPAEEQSFRNESEGSGLSENNSSVKFPETELVGQFVDASYSSKTDLIDRVDSLGSTISPAHRLVSTSLDVTAVGQTNVSSLSSVGTTTDLPIKLQFGLFSGQPLIPSPLPTIHIGSIQMPLHVRPSVGPSVTYMDPSQPPVFQFGHLQYTSSISQGILSIAPQSMSFSQPKIPAQMSQNQRVKDASLHNVSNVEAQSLALNKHPGFLLGSPDLLPSSRSLGINPVLEVGQCGDYSVSHITSSVSNLSENEKEPNSFSQVEENQHCETASKNFVTSSKDRGSQSQMQHQMIKSVSGDKHFGGRRSLGSFYASKGNRFVYAVKNSNSRHDMTPNSTGFHRKPIRTVRRPEFRIRENDDRKEPLMVSLNESSLDDKSSSFEKVGGDRRSGSKSGIISSRPLKPKSKSEHLDARNIHSQNVKSEERILKDPVRIGSLRNQNISKMGEADLLKNVSNDSDAPLLRGVVHIYKQPDIEVPSDDDDFIEVRSKRQMLNDRREQREKEIKAKSMSTKFLNDRRGRKEIEFKSKSLGTKPPLKSRTPKQSEVISRVPNTISTFSSEEPRFDLTVSDKCHLRNEISTGFSTVAFQPLAPIGTPTINSEALTIKHPQTSSVAVSGGGTGCETKNKILNQIQSSSGNWSTSGTNQQVMSLTQTQLEEAMKPVQYDSLISSSTVSDPIVPVSSILAKDKTFSSSSNPINSLLAGEKIQFGAVTSPSVLPPSSRVVSQGIGTPGSNRLDMPISCNFSVSEEDSSLFFRKDKHSIDTCPLQDSEAEAEAAASAVAVAAICVDDIVSNGMGPLSTSNSSDNKSFAGTNIDRRSPGVVGDQHLVNPSGSEELLSVSLPADLSVETAPISIWPPLPSPQSSSQMLSQYPGGPSHYPFYEMNPILEGSMLAFGPHEEPSGTRSQPLKNAASNSGPMSNWQQWHTGVDSFYNPPGGYPGRFISPSNGIPGVQAPPHMVVYNHFAPVGQYGPFGLSFMGATFIPSGQSSTAIHVSEGDIINKNTILTQHNASNLVTPIQHLAAGSPLLPMASPLPLPLPMFNLSSFQTASDLPVQARRGHLPTSQPHSVPVSQPLQSPIEVAMPFQVNHGISIDHSVNVSMFSGSQIQTPSENVPSFSVASETGIAPFPAELGLVDSFRSSPVTCRPSGVIHGSSCTGTSESGKVDTAHEDDHCNNSGKHQDASSMKSHFLQKNTPIQQANFGGYNYHRGGISHWNNGGNEWSHRRMGFHGRNHSAGIDKGFPASKVKQIYVAKTDH